MCPGSSSRQPPFDLCTRAEATRVAAAARRPRRVSRSRLSRRLQKDSDLWNLGIQAQAARRDILAQAAAARRAQAHAALRAEVLLSVRCSCGRYTLPYSEVKWVPVKDPENQASIVRCTHVNPEIE